MVSRRVVLAWMGAVATAAWGSHPESATMRLLVHGRLSEGAARGLEFGVAEAARTASLMRRELELGTSAAGITGAIGVIAADPPEAGAIPADTPIVLLRDLPGFDSACTFRVGLKAAERQRALAGWRAGYTGENKASDARVVEWHPSLRRYGASELNERYRRETGAGMGPEAWLAWFAVKALVETALRHPDAPRCGALGASRFDGHKGRPLVFDPDTRALRHPVYVADGDEIIGEIG